MRVYCTPAPDGCGRPYRLRPGQKRFQFCPACRAKRRQTRKAVRAARAARPEASGPAGPYSADALADAIRDADAASERALALARSIATRTR